MRKEEKDLLPAEKRLRQDFVDEYLEDYDAIAACMRLGYSLASARSYANKFLKEPYTLRLLKEKEKAFSLSEIDVHKKKIISGLYKIAQGAIPGSAVAKVSAYSQLCKILGLEAASKSEVSLSESVKFYIPENGR